MFKVIEQAQSKRKTSLLALNSFISINN